MKIRRIYLASAFISIWILSGCVTTQVASVKPDSENDIEVFITRLPDVPYKEITYIEASGGVFHSKRQLLRQLKKRARIEGADAIIAVKYDYQFWWPYASGVGVSYK